MRRLLIWFEGYRSRIHALQANAQNDTHKMHRRACWFCVKVSSCWQHRSRPQPCSCVCMHTVIYGVNFAQHHKLIRVGSQQRTTAMLTLGTQLLVLALHPCATKQLSQSSTQSPVQGTGCKPQREFLFQLFQGALPSTHILYWHCMYTPSISHPHSGPSCNLAADTRSTRASPTRAGW